MFDRELQAFFAVFDQYTIKDLVHNKNDLLRLLKINE